MRLYESRWSGGVTSHDSGLSLRTENLIAHVVLPDEISEELLVDAGLVYDLSPEMSVFSNENKSSVQY
jgi:hypothetical protein